MAPPPLAFSQTLPRNFSFTYHGEPRTPERADPIDTISTPEPPQRQTFKLKRRRAAPIPQHGLTFGLDGVETDHDTPAIPTFASAFYPANPQTPTIQVDAPAPSKPFNSSSSPVRPPASPISPPRTPVHQMLGDSDAIVEASRCWETKSTSSAFETGEDSDWTEEHTEDEDEESQSRPTTAGGVSFSSSLRSQLTIGTAFTSPDQVDLDPFTEEAKFTGCESPSPLRPDPTTPKAVAPLKQKAVFTKAMEAHLWKTYNLYATDPTHTPFKIFPGQFPSAGVATRVARMARKSWRGPQPLNEMKLGHWSQNNHGKRVKDLGGVAPPLGTNDHLDLLTPWPKWPRSDGFVRRKLRQLVAHEHELKPYYSRLMQQRSPSPVSSRREYSSCSAVRSHEAFYEQPHPEFHEPPTRDHDEYNCARKDTSAFSTRDMNVSLAASTSDTMDYAAPIHQLAMDPTTPKATQQTFPHLSDDDMELESPEFPRRHSIQDTSFLQHNQNEPGTAYESSFIGVPIPPPASPPITNTGESSSRDNLSLTRPGYSTPPAPRPQVHQKSQSLHFGFRAPPTLGSPFAPGPSMLKAETIGVTRGSDVGKRPQLGSPLELAQPIPKRRAVVNNIERSHTFAAMSASRGPIRHRGYTMDQAPHTRPHRRGNIFSLFDPMRPSAPPANTSRRSSRDQQPRDEKVNIVSGVGLMPAAPVGPPRLRSPFDPEKH